MKAIGIMSGTSLDGIDICLVNINKIENDYKYEVEKFKSYNYSLGLRKCQKMTHQRFKRFVV